ncbi:uncharacterized protein LOC120342278 [Styela clava]
MRTNFVEVLIASATLTSLLLPCHTFSAEDGNFCGRILTREIEFKWSAKKRNLVASSEIGEEQLSITAEETEPAADVINRNRLCISAPDGSHVKLTIFLDPAVEKEKSVNSKCRSYHADCKISCLEVYDPGDRHTEEVKNETTAKHMYFTNVVRPKQSVNLINGTGENSTKTMEQIDRFPRNSIFYNRNQIPDKTNFIAKLSRRKQRTHKSKKKKSRKKRKNRTRKRELELFQLLLQYHELLMGGDVVALPKTDHIPTGISYPPNKVIENSEALKEVFNKINSFVESDKRKESRSSQVRPIALKDGSQTYYQPKIVGVKPSFAPLDQDRRKRQASLGNSTRISNKISNTTVLQKKFVPSFTLCGREEQWNVSVSELSGFLISEESHENTTFVRVSRGQRRNENRSPTWISTLDKPVLIETLSQRMELNVVNARDVDDTLLRFLIIKIVFVPNERETDKALVSGEEIQQISTKNIHFTSKSPTIENNMKDVLKVTSIAGQQDSGHGDKDSIKIAVGVAAGVVAIVVFISMCIFLVDRRRRQKSSSFSGKRPKEDLIDIAESEKCLSTDEKANVKSQYKISGRRKMVLEENSSDTTGESEFIMLEHENPSNTQLQRSNSRKQHCRAEDMTASHAHTHTSKPNSSHHNHHHHHSHVQTKFKHPNGTSKSTQHVHCIVCQIAENPHQPILTAQYASEFLPPASRPNTISGGCGALLPNNTFDKFNRMTNNPYRHSPSLSVRHSTLPSTVHFPDGEDLHKHRTEHKNQHHTLSSVSQRDTSFIKPPPNRTIFGSEDLPIGSTSNLHRKMRKICNGYPGPPTSVSKHGRAGSKYRHEDSTVNLKLISCLSDSDIKYSSHNPASPEKDKCICKYILGHIDEPPPEYSDVIREIEPCSSNTSQEDSINNNVRANCGSNVTKVPLENRNMSNNDDEHKDGTVKIKQEIVDNLE